MLMARGDLKGAGFKVSHTEILDLVKYVEEEEGEVSGNAMNGILTITLVLTFMTAHLIIEFPDINMHLLAVMHRLKIIVIISMKAGV